MNELELAKRHPEAFNALPNPYQNDSCLEFWVAGEHIYARPRIDQIIALGNWVAIYVCNHWETVWIKK